MHTYLYELYKGVFGYLVQSVPSQKDISSGIFIQDRSSSFWVMHPALFYINEMMERQDIYKIVSDHKHFSTLRFIVPPSYSSFLLCYWIFDLMDILSNELFFVESKIEIFIDESVHGQYINEFKDFIRKNIPTLQRNKILPIYAKFMIAPDFHIEHAVTFRTRFHILFLKEDLDHLLIQRLHFNIEL